jgi:hypothetical protein
MLSSDVTLVTCKTIALMHALIFLIYRTSLVVCLFYKVKLISNNKQRLYFGYLLLFVRIVFQTVHTALIKPEVKESVCKANLFKSLITTWGYIGTDFLIEIYIACKVIKLMRIAKSDYTKYWTNLSSNDSNFIPSSSSDRNFYIIETYKVFNAVIYWFTIRILMAILLNFATTLNTGIIHELHITIISTLNFIICVSMSLLLTYSKDIISYISHL